MSAKKISQSILRLARHYESPERLLKAVRQEHPAASKKDIVLAAFATMIEAAASDEGIARNLHQLVMDNRAEE